jgi:hypothetical protein
LELGLPFAPGAVGVGYMGWPKLPELLQVSVPGVQTKRDAFLTDIDHEALEHRIESYFDSAVSDVEFFSRVPEAGFKTAQYDPAATRDYLKRRGMLRENIVPFAFRPFDTRWIYWEPETGLLGRKVEDYWPHARSGKRAIVTQQRPRNDWFPCQVISKLGCLDLLDRSATVFPLTNLSQTVEAFVSNRGLTPDAIFNHIVATLHAPKYREENIGALRMDWPRVPLPGDAKTLRASAALGATLATLLDPETLAPGVSTGTLRAGLKTLGLPTKRGGKGLDADDLKLAARWGSIQNAGSGRIVMPGPGLVNERAYTDAERAALAEEGSMRDLSLEQVLELLGETTFDIHLNADAWWSNVPARVWSYTLGGYQVIKKWLSYREHAVLGRPLKAEEAAYVSEMVRRIAAFLMLGPRLDGNYAASKAAAVEWKGGAPES